MTVSPSIPHKSPHPKVPTALESDGPSPGGHETILMADDERLITKSTARLLKRHGYHTLTAFNGKEALAAYHTHPRGVNLVLLDMEMPEMSGMECLALLKRCNPDVRVVMISGHTLNSQMPDPIKAGAISFIQKPYDSAYLLAVIRDVLDAPARPRTH